MTKKHSSNKDNREQQDTEIYFEEAPQEEDFDRWMRASRVKRGFKPIKKETPPSPILDVEPIIFDDSHKRPSVSPPLINRDKFDGSPHPKKPKARQRKIKLSPGFRPDAEIDLHGYTKEEALRKVEEFLEQSIARRLQTSLIITGRGLNSESKEGVLKRSVWNWLEVNQVRFNLTFRWAPPYLGGKGAILIFWG